MEFEFGGYFRSRWFSIYHPDNWRAYEDDACLTLTDADGENPLQVSALLEEYRAVTDDDLLKRATSVMPKDAELHTIELPNLAGFWTWGVRENMVWVMWFLRAGRLNIFATYIPSTAYGDEDFARAATIVSSIVPLDPTVAPVQ